MKLLTVTQVQQALGVQSRSTVYDLMARGELPYVDAPGLRGRRVRQSDVEAFLERHTVGVAVRQSGPRQGPANFDASRWMEELS